MRATFRPSKASGTMIAPPSKSMAHRLILCAGLSQGVSIIRNVDPSEDILATLDCLAALGAKVKLENGTVTVRGTDVKSAAPARLPCRECGSTLRFFIPLCLLNGNEMRLTGSKSLFRRPLSVYEEIAADQNLLFQKEENSVSLAGRLRPGSYIIPGDISSQFISGLLFALPLLTGDSRISLLRPVESRAYIDMTIEALGKFGIDISWQDDYTILVKGGQRYESRDVTVEGDYSNAAFFEALNLAGGCVQVRGLSEDSLQGDRIYRKYFQELEKGCPTIDLSACPDLGPVLMAVAALYHGARFTGTSRLKIKESDRGASMQEELEKMGVSVDIKENEILVGTGVRCPSRDLDGHNDHRIVMALSLLLSVTGGSICGAEAVKKSLPDYFLRLRELGVDQSESS